MANEAVILSATSEGGPVPTGIWKLNLGRSVMLSPKSMTLWIVHNSENELTWVAVESHRERHSQIMSWSGQYGGPPSVVVGAGIEARLTSAPNEGIRTEGEFPGLGPFVEVCTLAEGGKRLVCTGQVTTPDGVKTYIEDFDWWGQSPHQPFPPKA
jgi:hypothetical protein